MANIAVKALAECIYPMDSGGIVDKQFNSGGKQTMLSNDYSLYFAAVILDIFLAPILAALSFKVLYRKDGTYRKNILLKILPLIGVALIIFKLWTSVLMIIDMDGAIASMLQLVLNASYGLVFIRFMYPCGMKYMQKAIQALAILILTYIGLVLALYIVTQIFVMKEYNVFPGWFVALTYGFYVLVGGLLLLFVRVNIKKRMPENTRNKPYLPKKRLIFAICMVIIMPASVAVVQEDIASVNFATLASPQGVLAVPSQYGGYSPYNPGFANVADERYYREKLMGDDVNSLPYDTGESYLRQSWAGFLSWGVILMLVVLTDRLRKLGQEKGVSALPYNMILWSLPFSSLYIHQLMYSVLHAVNGQLSILLSGGIAWLVYKEAKFQMNSHVVHSADAARGLPPAEPAGKPGVS